MGFPTAVGFPVAVGLAPGHREVPIELPGLIRKPVAERTGLAETQQRKYHAVGVAAVVPDLLITGVAEESIRFAAQLVNEVEKLIQQLIRQFGHSRISSRSGRAEDYQLAVLQSNLRQDVAMKLNLSQVGGMRLTLIALSLLSLPLVLFADMQPEGIGVMTAYIVPALVVLFFFVLMLDALMNRVFMIEQPPEVQAVKRLRMRLDLAAGLALLVIWGAYFRTLLET